MIHVYQLAEDGTVWLGCDPALHGSKWIGPFVNFKVIGPWLREHASGVHVRNGGVLRERPEEWDMPFAEGDAAGEAREDVREGEAGYGISIEQREAIAAGAGLPVDVMFPHAAPGEVAAYVKALGFRKPDLSEVVAAVREVVEAREMREGEAGEMSVQPADTIPAEADGLAVQLDQYGRSRPGPCKADHTPVKSSNIRSVAWEDDTLEVIFRSGARYRYSGVPEERYDELVVAKSPGGYLHRVIKPRAHQTQECEPVPDVEPTATAPAIEADGPPPTPEAEPPSQWTLGSGKPTPGWALREIQAYPVRLLVGVLPELSTFDLERLRTLELADPDPRSTALRAIARELADGDRP